MNQLRQQIRYLALGAGITFIAIYLSFAFTWVGTMGALAAAGVMTGITIIIGLIFYAIQYYRTKNALSQKLKAIDDMATHQTRTVEVDLPMDVAFKTVEAALMILDDINIPQTVTGLPTKQKVHIHDADTRMGHIEAGLRAKMLNMTDFIDFSKIDIQLQQIDGATTRIQIESRPASSIEALDLGRHVHYSNQLALEIRQRAQTHVAQGRLEERISAALKERDLKQSQGRSTS